MRILFVTNIMDVHVTREAVAIMYLSASLNAAGHSVEVSTTQLEDIHRTAQAFSPDLIAISTMTPNYQEYIDLLGTLKIRHDAKVVMGGVHPTFSPEVIDNPLLDAICVGEGEQAFVDFCDRMQKGEAYWETPNFWVKHEGRVYKNPVRPLIEDIDTIAFPDRGLFYDKYPEARNNPVKFFLQSRGCPYNCTYCYNKSYWDLYQGKGKRVRSRSVDNLIAEIAEVKQRYPLQFILFVADIFILSKPWVEEFADKYSEQIGIPFRCSFRADLVDEDTASALARAGCVSGAMGIETGSDRVRKEVFGRKQTDEQIILAMKTARKHGIRVSSYNILGAPTATIEEDLETLDLNKKAGGDYPITTFMVPFPKTEICKIAEEAGLISDGPIDYDRGSFQLPIFAGSNLRPLKRLAWLFALSVEFDFIYKHIRLLIRLPLDPIYWVTYKLWRGYCMKVRIFPVRMSFGEMIKKGFRYTFGKFR
jgi:radical SAM superfamily enzyme YgiQ (UPF0313 family)